VSEDEIVSTFCGRWFGLLGVKAADVGGRGDVESQIVAVRLLLFLESSAACRLLVGGVGGRTMTADDFEN
jgi:hypothetical protein